MTTRKDLHDIMLLAWSFIRKNGYSKSDALRCAWVNKKLQALLHQRVCQFFFKKVDGTVRQAFGTLEASKIPSTQGTRRMNEGCQVYFDTEKAEWRCFKKCNLLKLA